MRNGSENEEIEDVESPPPSEKRPADDQTRGRFKLCEVARKGAWKTKEDILNQFKVEGILAEISLKGNNALHIAAAEERSEFGIKLLGKINHGEHLIAKNDAGNTALWVAAASGNVELARKMLEKNDGLASIRGKEDLPYKGGEDKLPLYMAALTGHREMVELLYEPTKAHLTSEDLIELLVTLIERGLFENAATLVRDHKQLATAIKNQGSWETIFNCISRSNVYEVAPQAFEESLEEVMRLVDPKIFLEIIRKLMFAAAEQGNEKFLEIILREYPDLIFEVDENNYSLFHFAVMNRHWNIFELIDKNCSSKYLLTKNTDKEGNTILHLAARLPPSDRLTTVKGVVEQLWDERRWFKEVKKILHPTLVEAKNNQGKTAQTIFTEQHKNMKSDAEKWLKDTSNSMLMAATIITTITFAAIFQLPGGTDQKRGLSNLAGHPFLVLFVASDLISMMLSCLSISMFLISSQWEFRGDDYDRYLPGQVLTGLYAFFYSIVALVVASYIAIGILLTPLMACMVLLIGSLFFSSVLVTRSHLILVDAMKKLMQSNN